MQTAPPHQRDYHRRSTSQTPSGRIFHLCHLQELLHILGAFFSGALCNPIDDDPSRCNPEMGKESNTEGTIRYVGFGLAYDQIRLRKQSGSAARMEWA